MKAKPIIFNGDMVRAILDGRKTQTRRVLKLPKGCFWVYDDLGTDGMWTDSNLDHGIWHAEEVACPYGQPGDLLWVRETFTKTQHGLPVYKSDAKDADGKYWPSVACDKEGVIWTPSIHMPRWASRITLEITGVRVERLQDISESDALEEGITYNDIPNNGLDTMRARTWFRGLWSSIYGEESWHANPWVWVIEFNPHLKNVDEMLKV